MRFSVLWVSSRYDALKKIYSPHKGDFDEKPDTLTTKFWRRALLAYWPHLAFSSACCGQMTAPQVKLPAVLHTRFYSRKAKECLLAEDAGGCQKVELQGIRGIPSGRPDFLWSCSERLGAVFVLPEPPMLQGAQLGAVAACALFLLAAWHMGWQPQTRSRRVVFGSVKG